MFQEQESGGLPQPAGQRVLGRAMEKILAGRPLDREPCLDLYRRHGERVREVIAPDRLLVYRVQEGWEPLCRFLEVDVPRDPFPHVNGGAVVLENIRTAITRSSPMTDGVRWL